MAPNFPPWRRRAPQPKLGVEVVTTNISKNPVCTHGPSICFERFFPGGKSRKFYACSACRDQKSCPFFLWADQQLPKATQKMWAQKIKDCKPVRSHQDEFAQLSTLKSVSAAERGYCTVCNMLCVLPSDLNHPPTSRCTADTVITPVDDHHLQHPSQLVPLKQSSKCEAQYIFNAKTCQAVLSMVKQLHSTKLLCVGLPSVHEAVESGEASNETTSMLLDIDMRYRSFFPPTSFIRFNMFNQHFFDGPRARKRVINFLTGKQEVCVLCDPPFGARVELLTVTFSFLSELWREANAVKDESTTLPVLLMFPYFLECQVMQNLPGFTMLDYQIDYINHQSYTSGTKKAMKHGSAVRVYTNRPARLFTLPAEEGYRHCGLCDRWVYKANVHCDACGGCMGKDGSAYRHCDTCNKCVKPSWKHCDKCGKCQFQDHKCGSSAVPLEFSEAQKIELSQTCHLCGKSGHKRRECTVRKIDEPDVTISSKKKRKRTKKDIPTSITDEKARYMSVIDEILCK